MKISHGIVIACYRKSALSQTARFTGSLVKEFSFYFDEDSDDVHAFAKIYYEATDHDEIWPEGEEQTKRYVVRGADIILQMKGRETFFRKMKKREKKTLQRAKETIGW